jgi:hypothetical protein
MMTRKRSAQSPEYAVSDEAAAYQLDMFGKHPPF